MKEEPRFGKGEREDLFHKLKDEYVIIISNLSGTNYAGFLKDEFDGFLILNPHIGRVYTNESSIVKLIGGDAYIRESNIQAIRRTTKESLEGYCKAESREIEEKDKKQEK